MVYFFVYFAVTSGLNSTPGEEIETWAELEELIDDDGDTEMRTLADLVPELA